MRRPTVRLAGFGAAATLLVLVGSVLPAGAANPASGTTTGGQTLNVRIDNPTAGATVPPGNVTVSGVTSLGSLSANTNVLYVVDVSGSTASPTDQDCNGDGAVNTADDFNGNGTNGETIDCEISGVIALNNSLANVAIDVGLVQFESVGSTVDVNPAVAGVQTFTGPTTDADSNGTRDIDQAARALEPLGGTDFDDALREMNVAFGTQPAGERNIAYFISDGQASVTTGAGSPLQEAIDAGTLVNTYSVGAGAAGCDATSPLTTVASATGGTCTTVTNPAGLSAALTGTSPAGITRVDVRVDGGAPVTATIDALGNWSASVPLTAGTRVISATTVATDGTQVTADITVTASTTASSSTSSTMPGGSTSSTTPGSSTSSTSSTTSTSSSSTSTTSSTTTTTVDDGDDDDDDDPDKDRPGILARTGAVLLPVGMTAAAVLALGMLLRFGSRTATAEASTARRPSGDVPWGPVEVGKALIAAMAAAVMALVDLIRRR